MIHSPFMRALDSGGTMRRLVDRFKVFRRPGPHMPGAWNGIPLHSSRLKEKGLASLSAGIDRLPSPSSPGRPCLDTRLPSEHELPLIV